MRQVAMDGERRLEMVRMAMDGGGWLGMEGGGQGPRKMTIRSWFVRMPRKTFFPRDPFGDPL